VASKVGAELQVTERPDLDELVPAGRHDQRSLLVRGETHAGNPLSVAILLDGVLALTKSVPQLDRAITRSRHDLTVVSREGHGKNVLCVALELLGALARLDLPKTKGTVPRSRKSELSIRGQDNVRDEVVVAAKGTTGISVVTFLAGKGPYDDGLVAGCGKDHLRVLLGGGNSGNPVTVTGKNTLECDNWHLVSHD